MGRKPFSALRSGLRFFLELEPEVAGIEEEVFSSFFFSFFSPTKGRFANKYGAFRPYDFPSTMGSSKPFPTSSSLYSNPASSWGTSPNDSHPNISSPKIVFKSRCHSWVLRFQTQNFHRRIWSKYPCVRTWGYRVQPVLQSRSSCFVT